LLWPGSARPGPDPCRSLRGARLVEAAPPLVRVASWRAVCRFKGDGVAPDTAG